VACSDQIVDYGATVADYRLHDPINAMPRYMTCSNVDLKGRYDGGTCSGAFAVDLSLNSLHIEGRDPHTVDRLACLYTSVS